MAINYIQIESPVGDLMIVANHKALLAITFERNWTTVKASLEPVVEGANAVIKQCVQQLGEYFSGERKEFDLPMSISGTRFQQQSWQALNEIPYGTTRSYADQANSIGNPKAVRAVGSANGQNPICIVIPCHRVIGKSGGLAGFGGGLAAKKYLLNLEGVEI